MVVMVLGVIHAGISQYISRQLEVVLEQDNTRVLILKVSFLFIPLFLSSSNRQYWHCCHYKHTHTPLPLSLSLPISLSSLSLSHTHSLTNTHHTDLYLFCSSLSLHTNARTNAHTHIPVKPGTHDAEIQQALFLHRRRKHENASKVRALRQLCSWLNTNVHAHTHTRTQAHKHTSTQAHKHTSTQAHKHTHKLAHTHTSTQAHQHTSKAHQHTSTPAHQHTSKAHKQSTPSHHHTSKAHGYVVTVHTLFPSACSRCCSAQNGGEPGWQPTYTPRTYSQSWYHQTLQTGSRALGEDHRAWFRTWQSRHQSCGNWAANKKNE